MRILALSDVHNNLVCLRKLRALLKNCFDAIIVAGDIGRDILPDFFRILSTFDCPIQYVLGNWDDRQDHQRQFGSDIRLLDASFVTIGSTTIAGFSDFPSDTERGELAGKLLSEKIDLGRTILVCHYRLSRLYRDMPGLRLHIFGHVHRHAETYFKGTKFLNVAALDRPISARPRSKVRWTLKDCRNYNAGSCAIVDIGDNETQATFVTLPHEFDEWIAIEDRCFHGIEWVPEEREWVDPTDPRLLRCEIVYPRSR